MSGMSGCPLNPVQIGPLRIEWPVFLAPMAGYTDGAFRSLCLELGCGVVVTEMVSSQGLVRHHVRTAHYLDTWGDERPIGAQIYGSDPSVMAAAAKMIADLKRFDFLDINAGCPMPKIRNRGDGAGLMRDPAKLAEITRQVKAAVAGAMPVTVERGSGGARTRSTCWKRRPGWRQPGRRRSSCTGAWRRCAMRGRRTGA